MAGTSAIKTVLRRRLMRAYLLDAAELLSDVLASSSGTPTAAGLGTAQRMAPRAMS